MAALQRKSQTTAKDYSRFVSGIFLCDYIWKSSKENIKNAFISSQNILYLPYFPDDPFVEETYSDNPKLHDIMSWLNFTKKYIWLIFVDEKTFR